MSNRRFLRLMSVVALSTLLAAPLAAAPPRDSGPVSSGFFGQIWQLVIELATGTVPSPPPPITEEGGGTDPGGVPGKK